MSSDDGDSSGNGAAPCRTRGEALGGAVAETMLEHPVFVHWCVSCGLEAPEEARQCPRCSGRVQRHQRVLELPDEESGPLSLRSLRAALADVSLGEDISDSALLLFEQGPDPGVQEMYPDLAAHLASLSVPPAVQRALVNRGFVSLEQITAAVATAPDSGALALQLGLSPAAEVLLRRLRHAAAEMRLGQKVEKRLQGGDLGSLPVLGEMAEEDEVLDEEESTPQTSQLLAAASAAAALPPPPAKRLRNPGSQWPPESMAEEGDEELPPWRELWDSQMQDQILDAESAQSE